MILFPELFPVYLTSFERELSYNVDQVRSYIRSMIHERRKNPELLEKSSDLLSILIQDPTFASIDETHIIDEAITFFMAGSLTQATLLSNTICYLI
jgi:cytochrome P450